MKEEMKDIGALTPRDETLAEMFPLLAGLKGVVQYMRSDGGHGWIFMAAYDTEHMAQRYAAKCSIGNSEDWPWEYRAVNLAGEVLPPLDDDELAKIAQAAVSTGEANPPPQGSAP